MSPARSAPSSQSAPRNDITPQINQIDVNRRLLAHQPQVTPPQAPIRLHPPGARRTRGRHRPEAPPAEGAPPPHVQPRPPPTSPHCVGEQASNRRAAAELPSSRR